MYTIVFCSCLMNHKNYSHIINGKGFAGLLVCFFRGLMEDMLHLEPCSVPQQYRMNCIIPNSCHFPMMLSGEQQHNVGEEVIIPKQPSHSRSVTCRAFHCELSLLARFQDILSKLQMLELVTTSVDTPHPTPPFNSQGLHQDCKEAF